MASKASSASLPTTKTGWTRQNLPRVLLIVGSEGQLREEALDAIRASVHGKDDSGFNWIVLHGPLSDNESEALTPATVLDEVCTRSLFAGEDEFKIVLVRQADIFLIDYYDILLRNIDRIPAGASLLLEASSVGKLKITNFYKALLKQKAVVECEALIGKFGDSPDLELEVEKRARSRGLELSHGALRALMSRSASKLSILDEELDKLTLALHETGRRGADKTITVSEEDIGRLCSTTCTYNAFNFVDAVADRNAKHALECLCGIFDRGIVDSKNPGKVTTQEGSIAIVILGAMTWKLAQLQDFRAVLDGGKSEWDAFGEAKLFGNRKDVFCRALKKHTTASIRRCMSALFDANMDLRRGGARPQEVLEQLVWKMVRA